MKHFLKSKYSLYAILLTALILRIACYLWLNVDNLTFGDVGAYNELAENLISGRGFSISKDYGNHIPDIDYSLLPADSVSETLKSRNEFYYNIAPYNRPIFFWDPLWPHIMALFKFLGDRNYIALNLIGCIIGTLSCWLIFLLGRSIYNRMAGIIAALVMALEPQSIFYSSVLMTENLGIFLILLAIMIMYRMIKSTGIIKLIFLGVIIGLSYLQRANYGLILPIALLILILEYRRELRFKIAFVVFGFIIVSSPWWSRNIMAFNNPCFLPSKGVFNLWGTLASVGQLAKDFDLENLRRRPVETQKEVESLVNYKKGIYLLDVTGSTEIERVNSLRKQTIKFVIANKGLTIKRYFKRLGKFFFPWTYSLRINLFGKIVLLFSSTFIMLFGLLGLVKSAFDKKKVLFFLLYVIMFGVIMTFFAIGPRFRMPVMPIFMLGSGYILSLIVKGTDF